MTYLLDESAEYSRKHKNRKERILQTSLRVILQEKSKATATVSRAHHHIASKTYMKSEDAIPKINFP